MPRIALFFTILVALLLSACAQRYRVQGLVLDVNRNDNVMIVSHRAIPGYMDAMAMPFRVATPSDLNSVKRGDQVEFQLVVKRRNSLAEKVKAGIYDEYLGQYRFELRPELVVTISRQGEQLIGEAGGQRNELFAREEAKGELLTREFDGRGQFVRNEAGQISHLVYYEFGNELGVAKKIH